MPPMVAQILGTESIWFKISQSNGVNISMFWVASNGTNTINHGAYGDFLANTLNWYSKNNSSLGYASFSTNTAAWDDGGERGTC